MNRTSHTIRRKLGLVALSLTVAAVAVPAASAGQGDPGLVPSKLGTLDPRDTAQQTQKQSVQIQPEAGLVASVLGSPDTRDAALMSDGKDVFRTAGQEHGASGYGDGR